MNFAQDILLFLEIMNQRGGVQVKVVLIRHGESEANFENYWTGWLDVALTAKGREQAWQAGEKNQRIGYFF